MLVNTIECKGLTKKYQDGDKIALDSVSLSIPSNGIFALIGRNGAGKTTLVRILATQLELTSGKAEVNGFDVMDEPEEIRRIIAVVPQEARPVNWLSPMEQVYTYLLWRGFSNREARDRAGRALSQLGLSEYAGKRNNTLSGGIKRKVMVATVIASGAQILFLDEPTTGLDPIAREELWNLLFELKKNHFIFLTTHYLEEAEKLADSIGIIHEGKLLKVGTLDELRKDMSYSHSVKFKGTFPLEGVKGRETVGKDGFTQVFVDEKNAYEISRKLVTEGISFSINPVSLDNIFYFYTKAGIDTHEEKEANAWE